MDESYVTMVRDLLERHFPELHITPEQVHEVNYQAQIIDFPRSLYCDCKRCTSPFVEKSVIGGTLIITTDSGEYTAHLPGDPRTLEHKWE